MLAIAPSLRTPVFGCPIHTPVILWTIVNEKLLPLLDIPLSSEHHFSPLHAPINCHSHIDRLPGRGLIDIGQHNIDWEPGQPWRRMLTWQACHICRIYHPAIIREKDILLRQRCRLQLLLQRSRSWISDSPCSTTSHGFE